MLSTLPELPVKKFGNRIKMGLPSGPVVKNMHANAGEEMQEMWVQSQSPKDLQE